MVKGTRGTVRVIGLNPRASTDTQLLFAGLEAFANLGDSFEDYQTFTMAHPTFWPVEFRNKADKALGWGHSEEFHQLAITFRDSLRYVWQGKQYAHYGKVLKNLLGLEMGNSVEGHFERDADHVYVALRHFVEIFVEKSHPGYKLALPEIAADWKRGEFSYQPVNDFQRAVYALWRESWRARTCLECGRMFIAAKPPQLYCSVACSTAARRKRDLALWRATGDARRRRRRGRSVRKKGGK